MTTKDDFGGRIRLGEFELDLDSGDLHPVETGNRQQKTLLKQQPLDVLRMLIASHGKIVTREAIQKRLWPNDTIVDFDHSINVAIRILRQALGDSAQTPRYIETVARRGYRLCASIEWLQTAEVARPKSAAQSSFPGLGNLTGIKVSHYRVLEVIGGGGMGMIYKAEDLKLGRRVALKFLPEELANDSLALQRFEREAQSASALNHPNICTIHGFDEYEGRPFIVMELLEGESLLEKLNAAQNHRLPLPTVLEVAVQVSDGLQAAHEKGIIHRDIKPANIFLTQQGIAKILDFGLAKPAALEERKEPAARFDAAAVSDGKTSENAALGLTKASTIIGTARYMSPEQIRKETLDTRTDLFSFGLVLFEIATGQHAFVGETHAALQDAILSHRTPSLRDSIPSAPRGLDRVIARALEKDRERRYQSASEMRLALDRVRQEMNPRRRYIRRLLRYTALVFIATSLAWVYWSYRNQVTLSPTDTLVLADVTDRTSDPVLGEALTAANQIGMEQTPYLNILTPDKVIGNVMQLGLRPDAIVTPEVAKQICLRTNSKIVVATSVIDAGNRFEIELTATDCRGGKTFANVRQGAGKREELVHALGLAAGRLRRKLGESSASIAEYNQPLDIATSSSPEALQLLAQGYKHLLAARDILGAQSVLQQAIELDPDFALAYSALGAVYQSTLQFDQASAAEEKAYALRGRMTVADRFQAETGYFDIATRELDKSAKSYSQWLALFPHNLIARFNYPFPLFSSSLAILSLLRALPHYLLRLYRSRLSHAHPSHPPLSFPTHSLPSSLHWLALFPHNLIARFNYAYCLNRIGRPDEAAAYLRDVARNVPFGFPYDSLMESYIDADHLNEAKITFDEAEAHKFDTTTLRDHRALLAFLQRDNVGLESQWKWAAQSPQNELVLLGKTETFMYLGQLHAARRSFDETMMRLKAHPSGENFNVSYATLAMDEGSLGNADEARRNAANALAGRRGEASDIGPALALALVGDLDRAQKLADSINQRFPRATLIQNYELPAVRAAMQLSANNPAEAIESLRPALQYDLASPLEFNSLFPAYLRGLAYLRMNDGHKAAVEFQKLLDHPGLVGRDVVGALALLQMARAKKISGDEAGAREYYERFLDLWKDADPDIPIYRKAKAEEDEIKSVH